MHAKNLPREAPLHARACRANSSRKRLGGGVGFLRGPQVFPALPENLIVLPRFVVN